MKHLKTIGISTKPCVRTRQKNVLELNNNYLLELASTMHCNKELSG